VLYYKSKEKKAFLPMINNIKQVTALLLDISRLLGPYRSSPNSSQKALLYLLASSDLLLREHNFERGELDSYLEYMSSRLYTLGCCSVGLTDLLEKKVLDLSFALDEIRFFCPRQG
jgi:hypothetical protein